jgi:hypothetical protein
MEHIENGAERREYIAPALIEADVDETAFGGITDIVENGFYRLS